jgi:nitroreductase
MSIGRPRHRRQAPSSRTRTWRLWRFPDDRFCALLIPLGYPADRPLRPIHRPNRRPFDEVVHRERW